MEIMTKFKITFKMERQRSSQKALEFTTEIRGSIVEDWASSSIVKKAVKTECESEISSIQPGVRAEDDVPCPMF